MCGPATSFAGVMFPWNFSRAYIESKAREKALQILWTQGLSLVFDKNGGHGFSERSASSHFLILRERKLSSFCRRGIVFCRGFEL